MWLTDAWKKWIGNWSDLSREKRFFIGFFTTWLSAIPYVLSLLSVSVSEGTRWLQHNPSFALFEFTFKAMAIGSFLTVFPDIDFELGFNKIKGWALLIVATLLVMAAVIVVADAMQGREKRAIIPIAVDNENDRKVLLPLDLFLRKQIRDTMESQEAKDLDEPVPYVKTGGTGSVISNPAIKCVHDGMIPPEITSARACYGKYAMDFVEVNSSQNMTLLENMKNAFHKSSWPSIWMTLLTFTSACFIVVTLWYLLVIAFSRMNLVTPSFEALLLSYGFIITWFPLRMYSVWYENYYVLDLRHYPAFYIAAIVAFVFLGLLFLLKTQNMLLKTLVGGLSGITVVIGAIAKFDISAFNSIAWLFAKIDSVGFIGLFIVLLLVLFACLSYYSKETLR